MGAVRFSRLTPQEYADIVRKDADTIYFVSVPDTHGVAMGYRLYLGDKPIVTSTQ